MSETKDGLSGIWYIVPTAFDNGGELDLASQGRIIEAAIDWGVDGLTAMGVLAEPGSLSGTERAQALGRIMDAARGRVPVAVGCSGAGARLVVELIHQARDLGAMAAMVSAPPLLRNVDLLPDFYKQVSAEGGLPIIVQDEPAATGVLVPASVLLRCVEASGATTVKLEDPPTPPKIARLLKEAPHLRIFGGLGGVAALSELRRGARGTMTGFAYPEILAAVLQAHDRGDGRAAARVFDRYLPLIQFEAQPVIGLGIRKEVLRRRGALATNVTRGLTRSIDPVSSDELTDIFERLDMQPGPARFEPRLSEWPRPVSAAGADTDRV
ncbi:MAG: dihydrodipicolinate synthase family protein [Chloroflexota bacterium]